MLNKNELNVAVKSLLTIQDMMRWAVSCFNQAAICYGQGSDNPVSEAVWLIAGALSLEPPQVTDFENSTLLKSERQKIASMIAKRINERIPAAYITQRAWFAGLEFYVDERTIIPRSPFAELIQHGFLGCVDDELEIKRVLDLCTGSGCMAIAVAEYLPDVMVDAVDISDQAIQVAEKNIRSHAVADRVNLIKSDLFANLNKQQYDLIVCNPPYVSKQELDALAPEFHHEPSLALLAENNGLAIVEKILKQAVHYLSDQGSLILEVGYTAATLMEKYPQAPWVWLAFENGGDGVFSIKYNELKEMFHVEH